ncbi:MAG TPA: sulfite exporter TauE/SafE family protein [Acidimicrobiales bacterium]|nr:sulfite exporter TauE/SafE family protein [Acidimicrobiales bacterium]
MSLSVLDFVAVGGATLVAGAINAMAGGGTLVSFPTLVAVGVPALPANVTNTVALCPGYLSGTWAQREDLAPQRRRVAVLSVAGAAGGLTGSALLEITPEKAFTAAVPWLLLLSCVLLLSQDRVRAFVRSRTARTAATTATTATTTTATTSTTAATATTAVTPATAGTPGDARAPNAAPPASARVAPLLVVTVFAGAVYGGFFGAGLGIMLLALLGLWLDETMVRINAVKQALQFVVNVCAAIFFAASGHVRWEVVPVMAVAGIVGGTIGGRLSRVVDPTWLRRLVVVFGLAVAIDFWLFH